MYLTSFIMFGQLKDPFKKGVMYGPLHYQTLEMEKFLALKDTKGTLIHN